MGYELDLSNKVLNTYFGPGTGKISEVKVGDGKKICRFSLTPGAADSNLAAWEIFSQPPTLASNIFAAS